MWRIFSSRKCFKRKYFQILQFMLLLLIIMLIIYIVYSNLPFNKNATSYYECDGWRNNFIPNDEEKRIFQSVRMEHIRLLKKLEETTDKLDSINKLISIREEELKYLEIKIGELKLLRKEYNDRRNVQLKLPNSPIYPPNQSKEQENVPQKIFQFLEDSIDYSRCSISSFFRVFIYPPSNGSTKIVNGFYMEFIRNNAYITLNPKEACIFVAILEDGKAEFNKLAHFGLEGRNHLLIDLKGNLEPNNITGAALILSSGLNAKNYRPKMDIAAFLFVLEFDQNLWEKLPLILPATRKYLLNFISNSSELSVIELKNLMELKRSMDSSQDNYLIDLECTKQSKNSLCFGREERQTIGRQSIFTLIIPNRETFQQQFYECLEDGSIPVIFSLNQPLPFDEMIDWRLATIQIQFSRFPEIHFILHSISSNDILEMKRKGRFFFENLLANRKVLVRSILSVIRHRLQMPGKEEFEPFALPIYNKSIGDDGNWDWNYPFFISTAAKPPYDDEYLGANEVPIESPKYIHNFTSFTLYSSRYWNDFPFATANSPEFILNDHPLPSDAEFQEDTFYGMRPISPGSGVEFSKALGGNRPKEQFTIVIATFNREQVLMNTLERMIGLPYLNRIIVIWNDWKNAPILAAWPRLHVPLLFVNGTKNSLNNRFIPWKEIETEAILSMDDDIDLKQYEIIFAFRVWREQRDRIVGFPARYNAHFDGGTFYNSNHTCQYSIVLTGAAFIHKFYFNAYTFHMPQIIRIKVDEWMNCEDLAMNFLVAHLTRKPPIKTTSKWTLKCPTCAETLSKDIEHFNERHECIRFFTRVYGYNPLLFTQFRVDSVLFKTRVPANHQKCFRYV